MTMISSKHHLNMNIETKMQTLYFIPEFSPLFFKKESPLIMDLLVKRADNQTLKTFTILCDT